MSISSRASHGQRAPIKMAQRFSAKSRITVVFAGVSEGNVSRETFLAHAKENVKRDGLFLKVRITEKSRWRKKFRRKYE